MKKFLIGLVCGILLAGLTLVVLIFSFIRLGERRPSVADGSTLVLQLGGSLPEIAPVEIPLPVFEGASPMTVVEVWDLLRKAAADSRVRAVVVEPLPLAAGWAKMQELREALVRFKRSGKPLIAFLRAPGLRQYYLATAADKIYVTGEDVLDLKGMRAELIYLKAGLDKLGVEFEVEHAGKYKDAADMFTRTGMSPETREVVDSVLDSVYDHVVRTIAGARDLKPERVRAALDDGPLLAHQAKEKKLVDGLLHREAVYEEVRKRLGQSSIRKLSQRDYVRVSAAEVGLEGRAVIAVLTAQGVILRGTGEAASAPDENIVSEPFIRLIREVGDSAARGVVVRVDSPGGDAVASEDILHELRLLGKKKPLVISMSDTAASGGYYISMTGDPVVAHPATFTGSIGVLYGKLNLRGLYEKLGVRKEILTRGRHADIDSDYKPLGEAGRKKLREGIDKVYEAFLERVAEGRRRKPAEIEPLAQGRVWLGAQARERGLIDEVGGLDRAIEMVRRRANIADQEKIRLVIYPRKRNIFELLWSRQPEASLESSVRALTGGLDLGLWRQGGLMRIMPYSIELR
jgi:protease-4